MANSKCDGERQVTFEQGKVMADSLGIDYIETNVLTGINVDELFEKISINALTKLKEKEVDEPQPREQSFKLKQPRQEERPRHTKK